MTEPDEQDAYRGRWLASLLLIDRTPDEPPITIEFRTGEEAITVETREGSVHTHPGTAEKPDLILAGSPQLLVGVVTGQLKLATARARGLRTRGNAKILSRLLPEPAGAEAAAAQATPG
jgi:hypothetical protein